MTVITRPPATSPLGLAWLLIVGALVIALAASVAIVGTRLLSTGPDGQAAALFPIPSGDEAIFAFASQFDAPDGGGVFTMRADGTDLRQLTDGPGLVSHPIWSPDGTRIAYHLWQDGADSVVVMDGGGGSVTTLATNSQTSRDCLGQYGWSVAWSPDGADLLFPTRDGCSGGFDLNIVPADGSSPATRLLAPGIHSLHGAWSPDGTRIAYLGSEETGAAGLYVAELGAEGALAGGLVGRRMGPDLGPNLAQVTFEVGDVQAPQWSPDGTELAVTAAVSGFWLVEADGVYIVKADGSGERLVAERAGNPRWSPDGTELAIQRTVDESEYWNGRPCTVRTSIISVDGTDERELPDLEDGCEVQPAWSPDGTQLAVLLIASTDDEPALDFHLGFVAADSSRPALVLSDMDGGSWQPVVAPLPPAPIFPSAEPS